MGTRASAGDTEHGPRPEIAASWARSSLSGVAGDRLTPPPAPSADPRGRLAVLAAPVLDRLATSLNDTRTTVVLTDARAGILDRRAGTRALGDLLDGVGLVPGYSYAEDVVGTNGMGTAAEERRAVRIVGTEHYTEALHPLTCVGVPIEHPVTGRLEGVLDLTCFNEDAGPWMSALVGEAVSGVRALLEEQATVAERALLSAFLRASHRASGAVLSLSESFVLTNPAAARLLDGVDHGALWELGAAAVAGRPSAEDDVVLAGGERVRARFDVVSVGGRAVGAVVRLGDRAAAELGLAGSTGDDGRPDTRSAPSGATGDAGRTRCGRGAGTASSTVGGAAGPEERSAAGGGSGPTAAGSAAVGALAPTSRTRRLVDDVAAAVGAGDRVLVRGPSGAGKATVADLALAGAAAVVVDAGRSVVDGAHAWLVEVEAALVSGRPVLIRHLDALAADAAAGLAAVLDAAPAGAALVATASGDAASSPAAQALVDRFGRVVRVPGIAERADELPGLIRSIVGRLVPTGAVRVGPEVVQALSRVDLPGNLRQLESVLHRVVVRRRTGSVTLDDLPPEVRAATHRPHLTAMEQHECEAIAGALAATDGNKAAAATALGISRSTLYRKLEAYGLDLDRRAW